MRVSGRTKTKGASPDAELAIGEFRWKKESSQDEGGVREWDARTRKQEREKRALDLSKKSKIRVRVGTTPGLNGDPPTKKLKERSGGERSKIEKSCVARRARWCARGTREQAKASKKNLRSWLETKRKRTHRPASETPPARDHRPSRNDESLCHEAKPRKMRSAR